MRYLAGSRKFHSQLEIWAPEQKKNSFVSEKQKISWIHSFSLHLATLPHILVAASYLKISFIIYVGFTK